MAPGFFIFILFVFLALFGIFFLTYSIFTKSFQKKSVILLLMTVIMLFVVGLRIRKLYFLNEPMAHAASDGNIKKVKLLLEKGASPDSFVVDCVSTALIESSKNGHVGIVRLLLNEGADPNLKPTHSKSALESAIESGHNDIAEILKKADPDTSTKYQ